MNLSVHLTIVHKDSAVIAVDGELDISTVALLDTVVFPMLGRGIHHLIVDASLLRFCDVCGFRALTTMHTTMSATGGDMAIAAPTPALLRLMRLISLTSSSVPSTPIKVYATVSHALRHENDRSISLLTRAERPDVPPRRLPVKAGCGPGSPNGHRHH
ncbi:STAS domain-containing protein [Streptosporangium subroseum]|uniref:STAS domain-containing protein n=1 Tax=Streptosporangium subroseum TaxID=106412 RepID=UPI003439BADC